MICRRTGTLGCLFVAWFVPVLAQNLEIPAFIDQKVELRQPVSATLRREATLKEGTKPAYVVTRQDLENQGARTVDEALKYLPGVRAEGTAGGQLGAQSSQTIRGASTAQVLILLDGRPINDLGLFGGFDLSQFTTESVEQIEVVPGGASTLYGADAVGGVINIVTRKPLTKDQFNVGTEIGSFGLNSQALSLSGTRGAVGWRIGYQRLRSENNFPFTINTPTTFQGADSYGSTTQPFSSLRRNADVQMDNVDTRLNWAMDDSNQLEFSLNWLNKDLGIPGGVPITTDPLGSPNFSSFGGFNNLSANNRQFTSSVLTQLKWKNDDDLTVRVFGDFLSYRFRSLAPDPFFPIDSRDQINRTSWGGQVQKSWQLSPGQLLTFGGDYRSVTARNTTTDFTVDRTIVNYDAGYNQGAFFIQDEITWSPEVTTVLGLRQDFNSNTTGQTNPSVGTKWQVTPTTLIRGNYAQSFRAPILFDSAYTLNSPFFQIQPNPNLKPERAENYDLGIDQKIGNLGLLRFTYFINSIADLNQFTTQTDPVTFNTVGQVVNLGLVRAQGTETSLDFQIVPNVYLGANYTTVDTRILKNLNTTVLGNQLSFRPNVFNVNVSYQHKGWYAGLFLRSVGSFFTGNSNRETLPGYTTLDLKLRYPLQESLSFNLSLNNLLDQRFEEAPGFPGLSMDLRAGVQWSF